MRKILILDDDYNELMFLETFFKKMGFDVIGIQKPQFVEKTVLGFIPQLFIVSYPSRNFDAVLALKSNCLKKNSAFYQKSNQNAKISIDDVQFPNNYPYICNPLI